MATSGVVTADIALPGMQAASNSTAMVISLRMVRHLFMLSGFQNSPPSMLLLGSRASKWLTLLVRLCGRNRVHLPWRGRQGAKGRKIMFGPGATVRAAGLPSLRSTVVNSSEAPSMLSAAGRNSSSSSVPSPASGLAL